MTPNSDQKGLTLKEMLILAACIAIIGIASVNVYIQLMRKAQTVNLINQTATIINNVFAFYRGHPPYEDLKNSTAIERKLIPAEMIFGRKTIRHPFKGNVIVRSLHKNRGFTLIYRDLPASVCQAIVSTSWGGRDSGLKYMFVNQQENPVPKRFPKKLKDFEYEPSQLPLPKEDAAQACKCLKNNCQVTFIFQ